MATKLLILTYYWPPSGGAGVQRWLKFVKYLPEMGWDPVVLTVDPNYAAYPVTDNTLKVNLPSSVRVYTTPAINYFSVYGRRKSSIPSAGFANNVDNSFKGKLFRFVRGNLFIPDPRKGWNRYALKKACELIIKEKITHVVTTSPPHSTQLIGLKLKKRFPGIKWIADLRDPWTDIYYYQEFFPTILSKAIDHKYERMVLCNADRIITVGNSLKDLFSLKSVSIKDKIYVIPNGFDESDFEGISASKPERFTITYVGTLSDIYPIGTFLDSLKCLSEKGTGFTLRFIGSVSPEQTMIIRSKTDPSSVEFIPYVDHAKAVRYMIESTVLLLIIPDHHSNRSIITGKLFEYLAAGNPVLCLGPIDGDAAEILRNTQHGDCFQYHDINGISDFLLSRGQENFDKKNPLVYTYGRKELTRRLVSILTDNDNLQ